MNYGEILACAESFHEIGCAFVDRIAIDVPEGTFSDCPPNLGNLVGSATNLSFALELYLKALRVQLDMPVPRSHNLWELYNDLPKDVRTGIEMLYNEAVRFLSPNERASITVAKGPAKPPDWTNPTINGIDLGTLLKRSGDLFVSWRYVFELSIPETSSYQFHRFEYRLLLLACDVIKADIKNREQGNTPT